MHGYCLDSSPNVVLSKWFFLAKRCAVFVSGTGILDQELMSETFVLATCCSYNGNVEIDVLTKTDNKVTKINYWYNAEHPDNVSHDHDHRTVNNNKQQPNQIWHHAYHINTLSH